MASPAAPWPFADRLPAHADVIDRLRHLVETRDIWRWFEVGCSIGAGRADELSDIDAGIGYSTELPPDQPEAAGIQLIESIGPTAGHLVHLMAGRPADTIRLAVEYRSGVQLDLVVMPAANRPGLPDGSIAVVDKDGQLTRPWTPTAAGPPSAEEAREWAMLGWWAVSDVTKYIRRGSLFEAVDCVGEVRSQALRLWAASRRIPYAAFGMTSLLDYPPFELPDTLELTYCTPVDPSNVLRAARVATDLLAAAADAAEQELAIDLATPWSDIARKRLAAAARSVRQAMP
jgi:hypothetical protein